MVNKIIVMEKKVLELKVEMEKNPHLFYLNMPIIKKYDAFVATVCSILIDKASTNGEWFKYSLKEITSVTYHPSKVIKAISILKKANLFETKLSKQIRYFKLNDVELNKYL